MRARGLLVAAALVLCAAAAGCLGGEDRSGSPETDPDQGANRTAAPGFVAPVELVGSGFEPSIEVGPEGAIYVTAPSPADNDTRDASWLWVSRDDGRSWEPPAEHPVGEPEARVASMEGDVAVDPRGWLYQVDTYYEDAAIGAWSDRGRTLEHARHAQATPTRDDRPWIAAVGDGTLVYVGNHMETAGPAGVYRTPAQYVYRSVDGGRSWAPVTGVPQHPEHGFGWASLDAGPSSGTVALAQLTGDAPPAEVRVMVSDDAGRRFSDPVPVAGLEGPRGPQNWPAVAVDGETIHVAWNERLGEDGSGPTRLRLARSTDGGQTWTVSSIGDGERAFAYPWVSASPSGQLGLSVYEAGDVSAGATGNWSIVAGVEPEPTTGGFAPTLSPADPEPVADTPEPLRDFHQNAFGPDGRLHVAYTAHHDGEPWIRWVATEPAG